jgi:hypothetical protein
VVTRLLSPDLPEDLTRPTAAVGSSLGSQARGTSHGPVEPDPPHPLSPQRSPPSHWRSPSTSPSRASADATWSSQLPWLAARARAHSTHEDPPRQELTAAATAFFTSPAPPPNPQATTFTPRWTRGNSAEPVARWQYLPEGSLPAPGGSDQSTPLHQPFTSFRRWSGTPPPVGAALRRRSRLVPDPAPSFSSSPRPESPSPADSTRRYTMPGAFPS